MSDPVAARKVADYQATIQEQLQRRIAWALQNPATAPTTLDEQPDKAMQQIFIEAGLIFANAFDNAERWLLGMSSKWRSIVTGLPLDVSQIEVDIEPGREKELVVLALECLRFQEMVHASETSVAHARNKASFIQDDDRRALALAALDIRVLAEVRQWATEPEMAKDRLQASDPQATKLIGLTVLGDDEYRKRVHWYPHLKPVAESPSSTAEPSRPRSSATGRYQELRRVNPGLHRALSDFSMDQRLHALLALKQAAAETPNATEAEVVARLIERAAIPGETLQVKKDGAILAIMFADHTREPASPGLV